MTWTRTARVETFRKLAGACLVLAAVGCEKHEAPSVEATGSASAAATAAVAATNQPKARTIGCVASGSTPMKLGSAIGTVHGLVNDAAHLYYTTWQTYGNRGDLGEIQKNGEGMTALLSLDLEPRGLALDQDRVYFTEGIRLKSVPKRGGAPSLIDANFSSQSIASYADRVYGVPGDYGPYDRVVVVFGKGGEAKELATSPRPASKRAPLGYSAIVADASGVYVTDSGHGRVLRFPLGGGKPKSLTSGQDKPFDLASDDSHLYFDLAKKGHLMKLEKTGGKAQQLASGLVENARIALESGSLFAAFLGETAEAPRSLDKIEADGGTRAKLATVPSDHTVEAITADHACVYWAEREAGSGKLTFFAVAR